MRTVSFVCAAIVAAMMPAVALADDPHDPAMRSAAARAHDRETIRQLNLAELARVRKRDARYAEGWRTWRDPAGRAGTQGAYAAGSRDYERDMADYARDRTEYERKMASWRQAVAACRAGDYSACDN